MSDERNDDEILGRALSRAIETQPVEETPYEHSRVAVRPLRRGLPVWQLLGAAAVLVLAVAFGAWFTRPSEAPIVATSPSPTPAITEPPQSAVPTKPQATATPGADSLYVFYARESLPPIGGYIAARLTDSSAIGRVAARLVALHQSSSAPQGATNPLAIVAPMGSPTPNASGGGSSSTEFGVVIRIDADTATVEFNIPTGWGVHGAAQSRALLQQLVYTITEEPGIHYARIVEKGKTNAVIDGLVVNKALARDDVSGYTATAQTGTTEFDGNTKLSNVTGDVLSREIVDGTLVRYTFVGSDRAHNAAKVDLPPFAITFKPNDGTLPHNTNDGTAPAYMLSIAFHVNATGEFGAVGHVERVDRSPLRLVASSDAGYTLGLDDSRPWRAYEPDPQHLVVEIGGDPRMTSDRIALTAPAYGGIVPTTFTVSGLARTFEANVVWRIEDTTGKVIASGHTTASIGTSALWGTFSTQITVPPVQLPGNIVLQVYEVSPKDGTEQGVVSVPLVVR